MVGLVVGRMEWWMLGREGDGVGKGFSGVKEFRRTNGTKEKER